MAEVEGLRERGLFCSCRRRGGGALLSSFLRAAWGSPLQVTATLVPGWTGSRALTPLLSRHSDSTQLLLRQGANLLHLFLLQIFAMFFAFCLYYNFD